MPNNLGLAGAQSDKQVKFVPLYTGRWSSGLWTNRSPLRDATTSRIVEKFYGQAGDALIAGLNVEVTNRLTLARRPGISVYDSNSYNAVDSFYPFKLFNTSTEKILVMIDQANALYSLYGGTRTTVLTKSAGAGQTFMQSVGNTLYFGDGIETGKWLQTLTTWQASTIYGTDANPFFSTFFIDANGYMMQVIGTSFPITGTALVAPSGSTPAQLTITSSVDLSAILTVGDVVTFPYGMNASWLDGVSASIASFGTNSMTVVYPLPWLQSAGTTTETSVGAAINGGTPTSGTVQPVGTGLSPNFISPSYTTPAQRYNVELPTYVVDGSVLWACRGSQTENWGLANKAPKLPFTVAVGTKIVDEYIPFWAASTSYSGGFYVVDSNNNIQYSAGGGSSGTVAPIWNTILGETTTDNTVTWTMVWQGALSPLNGGYQYCVALVNSLDNTVSNVSYLSNITGNWQGAQGFQIPPGAGLPPLYRKPLGVFPVLNIDSQADYVAIFRTTDGQSTPFLIPGESTVYTLPLGQYIAEGYLDNTPDTQLNNLISAPILLENTPPPSNAINLSYHLGSIWYSIGNIVYWTSGPDTPIGNGLNGTNPLNFDGLPSLVTRLVPISSGMLVFTVSDVYIIQGSNTTSSPLVGAVPLLPGIGLSSYNALDANGSIIGMFTTDNQFILLDPSSGVTYAGFPIGDQLRLNNGNPGQSWNPATAYVAWHVNGEDQGWYLGDAVNGWYRLISTPAPESGYTWCPFAVITNGVKALESIEVTPGVHKLLLGPVATGEIYKRDLSVFSDNGTAYPANAVVGSAVLTQPGQVALVDNITTDAVKIGSPLTIGILVDEAYPYYTGPVDVLTKWESDPPNLPPSNSFYSQRFYLAESKDEVSTMRHLQMNVIFNPADVVQNELLTLTVFGSYSQEI